MLGGHRNLYLQKQDICKSALINYWNHLKYTMTHLDSLQITMSVTKVKLVQVITLSLEVNFKKL